jgi:hypothetical protein
MPAEEECVCLSCSSETENEHHPQKEVQMKDTANFGERVLYTEEFLQEWRNLPYQQQQIIQKRVGLLIANPDLRSLNVRRLQGKNLYECYLMSNPPYRLWFARQGNEIILMHMGRRLARNTAIHRTESAKAPDSAQPQESFREDFIIASAEKAMTAFLESEPHYENLYRRLADM